MPRGQPVTVIAIIVLALITVAGIVTVAVSIFTPADDASFGWFAYAPISGSTFNPGSAGILHPAALFGVILIGLGLVGLSFLLGMLYGRQSK